MVVGALDVDATSDTRIGSGRDGVGIVVELGGKGTVADNTGDGVTAVGGEELVVLIVPTIESPIGGSRGAEGKLVAHQNAGGGVRHLGAGGLRGVVDSRHGELICRLDEVGSIGAIARAVGQGEGVGIIGAHQLIVQEPARETVCKAGRRGGQGHLCALRDSQRRGAGVVLIVLYLDGAARGVVGSNTDSAVLRDITENSIIGKVGLDIVNIELRSSTLIYTT